MYLTGDNRLTGAMPTQLGNIATLQELHLHGNDLTGSIPVEVTSIPGLLVLNLESNQFTGSISVQSTSNSEPDSDTGLVWQFESIESLILCE